MFRKLHDLSSWKSPRHYTRMCNGLTNAPILFNKGRLEFLMKMYVIDCGRMLLQESGLVADQPDIPAGTPKWVDIPICTYLFEHADGYVLFDTACDPEGMTKNWPEQSKQTAPYEAEAGAYLPERLKQLGVSPDDVRYVVQSHLHIDHAGCLKLFKKAEVFINESELMQVLKQYALRAYQPAYVESDIKGWLDAGLRLNLVSEEEKEIKLLEGLTIVNFGLGHAFGMMGLLVELEKAGNYLLVSDALHTEENFGPPVRLTGVYVDAPGYIETAEYIRKYAEEHHAVILFGHDKKQFESLIHSTDGFYE